MDDGLTLPLLLFYKLVKLHVFYRKHDIFGAQQKGLIVFGDFLFPVALLFLFHNPTPLLVPFWVCNVLGVAAFIAGDLYDIMFRTKPHLLNMLLLLEFFILVVFTLLSFLSAHFLEGGLFFVVSITKLMDLYILGVFLTANKSD